MKKENELKSQEQLELELQEQINLENLADEHCILKVVAGSHAYGTNIPSSDWDERGIFVDVAQRVMLPFEKIEQIKFRDDDKVYFELSKYMSLLIEQNPNVIELIWTEESDVLFKNTQGQLLLDHRKDFLSKKVKDSYIGYATSQLGRIKNHNKWINNPQPEREPQQADYVSVVWNQTKNPDYNKKVPFDGYVAVSLGSNQYGLWSREKLGLKYPEKSWVDHKGVPADIPRVKLLEINSENIVPDIIVKINTDIYDRQHTNWKMYWQWKTNRNEARSALEEKYGYDTKHAMHLIRLLRSGKDILEHGIVPVKRNDKDYLLDIRNGKYTYEEIVAESQKLSQMINDISLKSNLPEEPNKNLVKEIMIDIYKATWKLEDKMDLNSKIFKR